MISDYQAHHPRQTDGTKQEPVSVTPLMFEYTMGMWSILESAPKTLCRKLEVTRS